MEYKVIIPAAGQGKRMKAGKNKQFILLGEVPVIIHTLLVFEQDEACSEVILVINKDEAGSFTELLEEYHIQKVKHIVVGGEERQHSVYNGLKQVEPSTELILVHDGARPFITKEKIHSLVQEALLTGAAILAVPVKDTIKRVINGRVEETVERSSLWAVQTPQAFRVQELVDAYEFAFKHSVIGTDDASLFEKLDRPVSVVTGDYDNIKLTTQEDLIHGESILKKRKE
ncbi:2-C-methyl-D-erythritol 4-phosphate cytidylyltransferase [Bacillus sp. AK128]